MKWFYNLKISIKLLTGFILVALIAGSLGAFGIVNIKSLDDSDTELYENMTVPISEMSNIGIGFQRVRINLRDIVETNDAVEINEYELTIRDLRKIIDEESASFEKTIRSQNVRDAYNDFLSTRKSYGTVIEKVIELAKQNKDDEAVSLLYGEGKNAAFAENAAIDKLINIKVADAKKKSDDNTKQADSTALIMGILIAIAMALSIILGMFISKIISKPLKKAGQMINEMSLGHLGMRLRMDTKDEIGQMAAAMDRFADDLQNVVIGTMKRISDGDVSLNISPRDDKDEIAPALKNTIETIRSLVDETGRLIKTTQEGKLDTRGNATPYSGSWKELVTGINNLIDAFVLPINVNAEYIERISKGDIPPKITDTYLGDFNEIKNNLNMCIDAVNALVADANMLSKAAVEGKFETRADAVKHQGDYRKVVEGVNATLETVVDKVFWFEAILDSVPFPISVTDLNMKWTFINKATESLSGLKREEAIGKHCSNWNANICKTQNCGIECLRNNKKETVFEQNNINFKVNTAYINNSAGEKIGHIEAIQDISAIVKSGYYQKIEIDRLAENLKLLSQGNLELDFNVSEGDSYTKQERQNFIKINENLKMAKNAVKELTTDAIMLSSAAVEGNLKTRADVNKHQGEFRKIIEGVNSTLDSVVEPINVASKFINNLANGELVDELKDEYNGEYGTLTHNLNMVRESLNVLLDEANKLTKKSLDGDLSYRADTARLKGGYANIIDGINKTLDAVIKPVQESASVLNEMSNGNLQMRVTGNYNGDHEVIKKALNETLDSLSTYVDEISNALTEMANSNMVVGISGDYKGDFAPIKQALNLIIESFNQVLSDINDAADQVAVGSRQVSDGSQALSQGATEQASSIEQLTASITEIADQTKQNAASANEANELALTAKNNATDGNEQMKDMLKAMEEINVSSTNISKIIKVIDEIAFQTNILALNAAVEAARAGQHGKGFAVVAEEVRNLAARSASAAKETTGLIEGSIKKVEAGTKIANETAVALDKIVNDVAKAANLVGTIAMASNEQATGIAQVNQGVEQVSMVVQNNSATAQESAAASEELSSQADLLKEMIGRFNLKNGESQSTKSHYLESETKRMLSDRSAAKRQESDNRKFKKDAGVRKNAKIALSDGEFGKY